MKYLAWPLAVVSMAAMLYRFAMAWLAYERMKRGAVIQEAHQRSLETFTVVESLNARCAALDHKLTALQNRVGAGR